MKADLVLQPSTNTGGTTPDVRWVYVRTTSPPGYSRPGLLLDAPVVRLLLNRRFTPDTLRQLRSRPRRCWEAQDLLKNAWRRPRCRSMARRSGFRPRDKPHAECAKQASGAAGCRQLRPATAVGAPASAFTSWRCRSGGSAAAAGRWWPETGRPQNWWLIGDGDAIELPLCRGPRRSSEGRPPVRHLRSVPVQGFTASLLKVSAEVANGEVLEARA